MTAEHITLIEAGDIQGVELACNSCQGRTVLPLLRIDADKFRRREHACPSCTESLLSDADTNRVAALIEALQILVRAESTGVRLQLKPEKPLSRTP